MPPDALPASAPIALRPPHAPADHPAVAQGRVGILLINLGTPDSLEIPAIRRYLRQFLSDRRVIEVNPILWTLLLNGIIMITSPPKTREAYAKIWDRARDESPLRTLTRAQAEGIAAAYADHPGVHVDWAMRYGQPAIGDRLRAMQAAGCDRIYLCALYPQYAAPTTATVYDEAFRALLQMRWQPAIRTAPPWHDHPAYIRALQTSLERHLATLPFEPQVVLASFHGVPKRYLLAGDPYHCQCHKTARLLREALGWPAERLQVTFQSRFGREEWVRPYTDETLRALPAQGIRRVAVIMPGFVSDCVETLEEIAMGGHELFSEAGGTDYATIPCLNDSAEGLAVLQAVLTRDLAGWV